MPDFTLGEKLRVTLFGQSHGPAVGCVIEGYPAGRTPDWDGVRAFMARRAPGQNAWSTQRKEGDAFEILSGLDEKGHTCAAPIAALIHNTNTRSVDYPDLHAVPRPGHADFAANQKYGENWDHRGGGHFSARLTAPLCFAGALALEYLSEKGIAISAHIARVGDIEDATPDSVRPALPLYESGAFPVIDTEKGEEMKRAIQEARSQGDSIGGAVRCLVTGLPAGLGGPYFGGLEGKIAQAIFGIPAVRGLSFGDTQPLGSQNNDSYRLDNGIPTAVTNHAGGILGGISTGMPLIFTASFKPTPSIALPQQTVNLRALTETTLALQGRHDPCVVPRAVPVVEAATALILTDLILQGA